MNAFPSTDEEKTEFVSHVLGECAALRNENIAIRDRLAAIEIALDALTEQIATLTAEPVSPHEDTLVATDQLMRGDVVRWSSGTSNQWRIFDHYNRDMDGHWYAYMKDGVSRLIPSPSIRLWYRQS